MTTTMHPAAPTYDNTDDGYPKILAALQESFLTTVAARPPLFGVSTEGLFDVFLSHLPEAARQHYTCRTCRKFVERFGGIVTIDEQGTTRSALWNLPNIAVSAFFVGPLFQMARFVESREIAGVFLTSDPEWGQSTSGKNEAGADYHHFAVTPPASMLFKEDVDLETGEVLLSAAQAAANVREELKMLERGLAEFSRETVRTAETYLSSGDLYRSEKCIEIARWLVKQHEIWGLKNARQRKNLLWVSAATAPAGWCHVKQSMIGTLLDDVKLGLNFEALKRRFNEKMDPLQYQRPQAPPSEQNIAQAEKVVAQLGAKGALGRRYARIGDVKAMWKPRVAEAPAQDGSVFGHLKKPKAAPLVGLPQRTFTWVKFRDQILPLATKLEVLTPRGAGQFCALITAVNPDAPPLLQWDHPDARNPVSWYFINEGSLATAWNLRPNTYVQVTAITRKPSMWNEERPAKNHGDGVIFLLEGAKPTHHQRGGGMFVESMRSEFHAVRRTLEAHFLSTPIADADTASACGLSLGASSQKLDLTIRYETPTETGTILIDRWD